MAISVSASSAATIYTYSQIPNFYQVGDDLNSGRVRNFALGNNPDLKPEIVATRFKQVYEKTLIGRNLLNVQPEETDATSWTIEDVSSGMVDYITEEGGWKKLDSTYDRKTASIRPYGAMFEITTQERKNAKVAAAAKKISGGSHKMRRFEDDRIFSAIINAQGVNTMDGSDWTTPKGDAMGDPFGDIQKGKKMVRDSTKGLEATDIVMSGEMEQRLGGFDFVKNKMYSNTDLLQTGTLPKIAGLNLVVDDSIDPNDEGRVAILRRKDCGYIAETQPLTVVAVTGLNIPNPLIDFQYYCFAQGRPIIDSPEMITVIEGLKA